MKETCQEIIAKRRREDIAPLYLEGCDLKLLADMAEVSLRTIQRDVEYINKHRDEFLIM